MINVPAGTPVDKTRDDLELYPSYKLLDAVKEADMLPITSLSNADVFKRSLRRNSEIIATYHGLRNYWASKLLGEYSEAERQKLIDSVASENLGIRIDDFYDQESFNDVVQWKRTIEKDKYYLAQIPFISVANVFNIIGALLNPSTYFSLTFAPFKGTSIIGNMAANLGNLGLRGLVEGSTQAAVLSLDQNSRLSEAKEHILGNTIGYMLLGGAGQLFVKGASNISDWVRAGNMKNSVDCSNNSYKKNNQSKSATDADENAIDTTGFPDMDWEIKFMATEEFKNLVQAIKDNKGLDDKQKATLLAVTNKKSGTIISAFRRLLLSGDTTTDIQREIIEKMEKELLGDADVDRTAAIFIKTTALDFFARNDTKNEISNLLSGWLRSPIMEMLLSKSDVFRSMASKLFSTVFRLRKNERGVASLSAEDHIIAATNHCIHAQVQNRKRFTAWLEANNLNQGIKSWFMQGQYLREYERAVNSVIRVIPEALPYREGGKIIMEQAKAWRKLIVDAIENAASEGRIDPKHAEAMIKNSHVLTRRYNIGAITADPEGFIQIVHDEWYLPQEQKRYERAVRKNEAAQRRYHRKEEDLQHERDNIKRKIAKLQRGTKQKRRANMNELKNLKEELQLAEKRAITELAELKKDIVSDAELEAMQKDIRPEAMRRAKRAKEEIVADKMVSKFEDNIDAYTGFKTRSINIPDALLAKYLDTNTESNVLHFYKTTQTHTALFTALKDSGGKLGFRQRLLEERRQKMEASPEDARAYEEGYAKLLDKFEDYLSLLDNTLMKKQGASSEFASDFFLVMKNLASMAKLGFIFFSSLPDLSNLALRHSDLFRNVFKDKDFMRLFRSKEIKALNKEEAALSGIGYDAISSELFMRIHDLSPQTTTEAIYSKTNKRRIGEFLMDMVHKGSLMPFWQNWVRGLAYRIATAKVSYDVMHGVNIAHLGIDEAMGKRIQQMLDAYGLASEQGNYVFANRAKWHDKKARDIFEIALTKYANSTIIVPTKGNTPIAFHRSAFGGLVGLFQKFLYSMQNMLVLPLLQNGKGELAAYIAMSTFIAGWAEELKALARGDEDAFDFSTDKERKIVRFIANGLGGSGILGKFFGIPASMISRGLEPDTRLYEVARGAAGQLFGAGFDVPISILEGAFDLAMLEGDQAWKRLRHNIPMQNNFILQSFYNNVIKED